VRGETTMLRRRKRRNETSTTKAEKTKRMTDALPVCNEANRDILWFVFVFFLLPEPSPTNV